MQKNIIDYKSLGMRIREKRQIHNLTQEQLGEMINLSATHISHIENGRTKLSFESFINISNALEVSADELLQDSLLYNDMFYKGEICSVLEGCSRDDIKKLAIFAKYCRDLFGGK